ncbi:DUF2004 domain-containing protein [Winogradskyella undariae]|uniref:DUF2004 domain-containing protein n=1 Tax=Winogradskyella undariae TaxID=1285465 RepID=UPI00156B365B|nr:DUF2004 domain-containing protein [Winogradskyella undariae]NRR93348.1 DUF2004 domain-containing protein [Winogradskyella undariae]
MNFFKKKKIEKEQITKRYYDLPYIGKFDILNIKENYWSISEFDKKKFIIEINFRSKLITERTLTRIISTLQNIDKQDKINRENLKNSLIDNNSTIKNFIDFHIDLIEDTHLLNLINSDKQNVSVQLELIKDLRLVQLRLFPFIKGKNDFPELVDYAVYDYVFEFEDGNISNQVIVVNTDNKGTITSFYNTWDDKICELINKKL